MLLPDHSGGIAEVFMKKFLVAALSCAAGMLAAQSIWDGSVQSISVSSGVTEPKVLAADGGVTVTGKTTGTGRYSYLTFYVKTKPFTLNGKDLAITATAGDVQPGLADIIESKEQALAAALNELTALKRKETEAKLRVIELQDRRDAFRSNFRVLQSETANLHKRS